MTRFTQARINKLNLFIALAALILALPGGINQINQFFREQSKPTAIVNYSPPKPSAFGAKLAESCWESITSDRLDSFRCISSTSNVFDPCFKVSGELSEKYAYLYCPDTLQETSNDTSLLVAISNMRPHQIDPNKSEEKHRESLPWFITLDNNTSCRLTSGSVEPAYDQKGSIYGCEGSKYASVTNGSVEDGRYYFDCKLEGSTLFKKCLAKLVAF